MLLSLRSVRLDSSQILDLCPASSLNTASHQRWSSSLTPTYHVVTRQLMRILWFSRMIRSAWRLWGPVWIRTIRISSLRDDYMGFVKWTPGPPTSFGLYLRRVTVILHMSSRDSVWLLWGRQGRFLIPEAAGSSCGLVATPRFWLCVLTIKRPWISKKTKTKTKQNQELYCICLCPAFNIVPDSWFNSHCSVNKWMNKIAPVIK